MVIKENTPIIKLVKAGIVPEWMFLDCKQHGMYEAENILCEFDWEWDWDLGDGYTAAQLKTLADVRNIIKAGIEASKH